MNERPIPAHIREAWADRPEAEFAWVPEGVEVRLPEVTVLVKSGGRAAWMAALDLLEFRADGREWLAHSGAA